MTIRQLIDEGSITEVYMYKPAYTEAYHIRVDSTIIEKIKSAYMTTLLGLPSFEDENAFVNKVTVEATPSNM